MGIYIEGMKMPKTCCGCKMMIYNPELVWDDNGIETVGAWVCLLTAELIDNTKREEHCPLIELPPHGRLIDADALMDGWMNLREATKYGNETKEQVSHSYSTMMMYEIADEIEDAPIIIPADPEGGADG